MLVDRIDPINFFRLFHRIDRIEIDHHRLVVGADQHAFERPRRIGVDLLMRHEVTRTAIGWRPCWRRCWATGIAWGLTLLVKLAHDRHAGR